MTTGPGGEVEVERTDSLFAVDETGTLALTWPFGTPPDDIGADLARLLDAAAAG